MTDFSDMRPSYDRAKSVGVVLDPPPTNSKMAVGKSAFDGMLGRHHVPMMASISVLVVEDSPGDSLLVATNLRECRDVQFSIDHVMTLNDAISRLSQQAYDVVLLDLHLPDGRGLEVVGRLRSVAPTMPIVAMTGQPEPEFPIYVRELGAQDYLFKGEISSSILLHAITNAIYAMTVQLSRKEPTDPLSGEIQKFNASDDDREAKLESSLSECGLTKAELRVAVHVGLGLGTKDIARNLSCSPQTISIHRKNIRRKLGCDRSENLFSCIMGLKKSPLETQNQDDSPKRTPRGQLAFDFIRSGAPS